MRRKIANEVITEVSNKTFDIDEHNHETDDRLIRFCLKCQKTDCSGVCEAYIKYEKELRADAGFSTD